ncbi:ABC transporter family protein [Trichomonas vaginalis G3]|uniref:ABC transporter family protein n=1 Tax=Trichomonas vaginalis (strain ATCC PRA-98 / G3) TaxID=412133 RepID=A2DMC4_TRIV3|nr:ATP-binding cassette transporter subfamily A ABCA family [Trichomonas vaginalis G3]EAY18351.1 ABC transporter family protein [Trichomonas vaginalis G3]KAI5524186.1 ATP-binding cassette transporter subfamily A ABCA family [Trichomonas vaginalis G3]|eukprot:XP_001579337.1 ABC transporter family protein [Trichomonas vaginalis G3]
MTQERASSVYVVPPGGAWNERNPTFSRTVHELFKKQWLIKLRHKASIIEFIIALVIYIALYPVWKLARTTVKGVETPNITYSNPQIEIAKFLNAVMGQPTLVAIPDVQEVRDLINSTGLETALPRLNVTSKFQYVNSTSEMEKLIYASKANGLGIRWLNYDKKENDTWLLKPKFEVYRQSFGPDADAAITLLLESSCIQKYLSTPTNSDFSLRTNSINMLTMNLTTQGYAKPSQESEFDVSIAVAFFAILPIVLATMPDVQTILEEKDSKVMSLTFLMGCSELAYWLSNFLTQFILSFIPYIGFCAMLSYGFMMTHTDFTLLLVLSLLFIISHIFFQLWILTFIKKASAGRALTVIWIVFTLFFSYLHMFFTLSDNTDAGALKHVFSIVPLSAYQMVLMSAYNLEYTHKQAMTWTHMGKDSKYAAWMGLMWLLIDCVLYLFLFFLFNLCMSRPFCTPPLKWSELFKISAWKRMMNSGEIQTSKVNAEVSEFVRVKGLKKVFKAQGKEVTALDNVDFYINRGEVIVMIGPNGAGKSTLINILAGAIEPDEGKINILGGNETDRFKEMQHYLGVCFQGNVIINLLSVREHLYLFGAFRGVPRDQIDQAVEFFGSQLQLTHMMDNRAGDLSGGQKRKLCIAMSLLGNPPLVIMDEPTAGVDVQARQLIWKMISSLKDTTSIITSHALEEAEAVSSRLFIASSGQLKFCGTSTELRHEHKCGYVLGVVPNDGVDCKEIAEFVKSIIPEAVVSEERDDILTFPVCDEIPKLLHALNDKKDQIGLKTYSLSVEQLEDMLLKLIQADEAKVQTH